MAKIAIVVLTGQENPERAATALRVAKRLHDAQPDNGIDELEVFLFTEGLKILNNPNGELAQLVGELIEAGILVGACTNQLNNWNLASAADAMGVRADFARDAFARYARDGFTVLTF